MNTIKINQNSSLDYKTSEAFRVLRTNLEHMKKDSRAIAFTSVTGKEGKSFVAFHTACAMAAAGKSCVYINGNLREKEHNDIYSASGVKHTLADLLEKSLRAEDVVSKTDIENLYIIESGAPAQNASELLGRDSYKSLVEALKGQYDYVFLDTPAVGEVADGLLSAHVADGVVLVMEPEMVAYEQAQKVKNLLEVNGCNILGVVLNK